MFGWHAITSTVAKDHFFSHLCGNGSPDSPSSHGTLVHHYVPVQNGTISAMIKNPKTDVVRKNEGTQHVAKAISWGEIYSAT